MTAAKHSMMSHGVPYDYRVMYFQRTVSDRTTGYFQLPSIQEMNTNAAAHVEDAMAALNTSDFNYSVTVGFAPGAVTSGDRHMFGDVVFYSIGVINGKWRPGGVNFWPPLPNTPIMTGVPVRLDVVPDGYILTQSQGDPFLCRYTHGSVIGVDAPMPVLKAPSGPDRFVATGARYFESSVENDHSVYGFSAKYICVIKDGEPYIYDTVSGVFYPKKGGEIGIGPKCKDNFDPMTFKEG